MIVLDTRCICAGARRTHLSRDGYRATELQLVVRSARPVGIQLHASATDEAYLTQPTTALHPTEDLLDTLAFARAQSARVFA